MWLLVSSGGWDLENEDLGLAVAAGSDARCDLGKLGGACSRGSTTISGATLTSRLHRVLGFEGSRSGKDSARPSVTESERS